MTVAKLKPLSSAELFSRNNIKLSLNLIPKNYPKREIYKGYDEAFNNPIGLNSYKIEKLINN